MVWYGNDNTQTHPSWIENDCLSMWISGHRDTALCVHVWIWYRKKTILVENSLYLDVVICAYSRDSPYDVLYHDRNRTNTKFEIQNIFNLNGLSMFTRWTDFVRVMFTNYDQVSGHTVTNYKACPFNRGQRWIYQSAEILIKLLGRLSPIKITHYKPMRGCCPR